MQKRLACGLVLLAILALPAGLARGDEPIAAGRGLDQLVIERDGDKPVAGVTIRARDNRGPNTPTSRGPTDPHGACSVPVPPRSRYLHVHAWKDGFVPVRVAWGHQHEFEFEGVPATYTIVLDRGTPPDFRQVARAGPSNPPLVIRLGPGRTIRGRVVDATGRPIAGARIMPEIHGRTDLSALRAETDADGRFDWRHAPLEMEVLKVEDLAEGQEVRRREPGAGVTEIVLTMPRPFRLRGKIVNAETGRPIERCRLIEGVAWTHDFALTEYESPPNWSRLAGRRIEGGHWAQTDHQRTVPPEPEVVRVSASGFRLPPS
ncbi:MAG: carboxypeptidase-like regulatory domain-containing protein [Isosphaeraceae bacterium]